MNATVLCVGKMKEKPYREMADEYLKRLSRFGRIRETEVPDLPEKPGVDENQIRRREGERLLEKIHGGDYVIALTLEGKQMDSESFARHLEDLQVRGQSEIVFVIGGSLGLSGEVRARANEELCMGRMTFPQQLARGMILEQIYRAMKISSGERYHK